MGFERNKRKILPRIKSETFVDMNLSRRKKKCRYEPIFMLFQFCLFMFNVLYFFLLVRVTSSIDAFNIVWTKMMI